MTYQACALLQQTGNGMKLGQFQGFFLGQLWQQAG
jgi:hypothetical protein